MPDAVECQMLLNTRWYGMSDDTECRMLKHLNL